MSEHHNQFTMFKFCTTLAASVIIVFSIPACKSRSQQINLENSPKKVVSDDSGHADLSTGASLARVDSVSYQRRIEIMLNGDSSGKWPVKSAVPAEGAILPFKRVVAYYGNLYSTRMGILGELPRDQMVAKLKTEIVKWEKADPATPVQPALHYIAVTAQGSPGKDGKYRLRMPHHQIDSVLKIAEPINAVVFIDIQVGLSNLQAEIPELAEYLKLPNVHLGIDPEFSMKGGQRPGSVIGTFDAADVNYAADFLARLVQENKLPPKMLIVHRFTQGMVTNYKSIKTRPEVQVVMHMDGWGEPELKKGTYRHFIHSEPVQFTGFKLFYKNDIKKAPHRMMTPEELMKLKPLPLYIQYQ
jgi:hypothetical protein